jgi:hypothetical protein
LGISRIPQQSKHRLLQAAFLLSNQRPRSHGYVYFLMVQTAKSRELRTNDAIIAALAD